MSDCETNIWANFLRESSKRSQNQEATCVIVGNENSGKKTIAASICGTETTANVHGDILSFSYFDVEEKDLDAATRVNMWLFNTKIFNYASEIVTTAQKNEKILFVIILDLSEPDTCLSTLREWLARVGSFTKTFLEGLSAEEAKNIRKAHSNYVRNARTNKGIALKTENEETEEDEDVFMAEFFSLPILVVGNKADTISVDSSTAMKRIRELQGRIRSLCLDVGASLLFTSATALATANAGASTTTTSENKSNGLKQYLLHRLYPDQISMELQLEDKLESCFIPAGFDTAELIKISSGVKHGAGEHQEKLKTEIMKLKDSIGTEPEGAPAGSAADFQGAELEPEQAWLNSLHQFISQVSSTGVVSSTASSSAAHSRNPSPDTVGIETVEVNNRTSTTTASGGGVGIAATEDGESKPRGTNNSKAPAGSTLGPRRTSLRSNAGSKTEKKEVGDFFKNLLKK